jgi:hypothetical protein
MPCTARILRIPPAVAIVFCAAAALSILPQTAFGADEELTKKVDILASELANLREQLTVPETDAQLPKIHGLGPAASKIYGVQQGLSIAGYGEFYFGAPIEDTAETGATNVADVYRFIAYIGYKFNDRILVNSEVEWEHGGSQVSVEFSYLDFLFSDEFNIRAGNFLIPMGITNLRHEPTVYRGNFRPEVERRIIPSTWREMGVGAYGTVGQQAHYSAYLVNGLDASGFDSSGARGGRQKGQEASFEDVAGVFALDFTGSDDSWALGASAFYGQADQNAFTDAAGENIDVTHTIAEAHAQLKRNGFDLKALFAYSDTDGAGDLLASPDWDGATVVPERQVGWYVEAAYDVAPSLLGRDSVELSPWVRYEDFNLQDRVPTGLTADDSFAQQLLSVGLDFKPDPQVVIKAEYVHKTNDASTALSDEIRVGAGFIY